MIKYYILVLMVFISCSQNTEKKNSKLQTLSKSRLEQVRNMKYRTISMPKSLENLIVEEIINLLKYNIDNLQDNPELYKISDSGKSKEGILSSSIEEIRRISYDLWKNRDFGYTALIYKSYSVDATTNLRKELLVVEIEHYKLTGTFFIFFENNNIDTMYADRN